MLYLFSILLCISSDVRSSANFFPSVPISFLRVLLGLAYHCTPTPSHSAIFPQRYSCFYGLRTKVFTMKSGRRGYCQKVGFVFVYRLILNKFRRFAKQINLNFQFSIFNFQFYTLNNWRFAKQIILNSAFSTQHSALQYVQRKRK